MIEVYYGDGPELLFVNPTCKRGYYSEVGEVNYRDAFERVLAEEGWTYRSHDQYDLFDSGPHTLIGTFATYDEFASSHPELLL